MDYSLAVGAALTAYMDNSSRSQQSDQGRLGPSDIGFCRQKAALMTKGVEATNSVPKWAAAVGTSIHNYVEAALKEMYPSWIMGSIDNLSVTATLPSGAAVSGHPDIVIPEQNTVLDIKTVDGYEWVKRQGTSQQHKYQRHLYAMGCLEAGMFDRDKPIYVGNVYLDRSGKQSEPLVLVEQFDYSLTDEIDAWITDVIYAVQHGQDASRDIPSAVCERICSHFTACRGTLAVNDGSEPIEDPELLAAVQMYVDARDMATKADQMKKESSGKLLGVNGIAGRWQVRWVEVRSNTSDDYLRLDIRKISTRRLPTEVPPVR